MDDIFNWIQQQNAKTILNPLSLNKNSINLGEIYKQTIPSSIRLGFKSLVHPTPITENNFSKKELELMKQVHNNSMNRTSGQNAKLAQKDIANLKKEPENQQVIIQGNKMYPSDAIQYLIENYSPTLQYKDYPEQGLMDSKHPIISSFNSPSYSMANTIGRAIYEKDKQGNTHIKDMYDMPQIDPTHMQNFINNTSLSYKNMHEAIRKYGGKMPVDINLRDTMEKH